MIVKQVKTELKKYGSLSLPELSQITGIADKDLEPLLNEWVIKKKVEQKTEYPFCNSGGCTCSSGSSSSCSESTIKYSWK